MEKDMKNESKAEAARVGLRLDFLGLGRRADFRLDRLCGDRAQVVGLLGRSFFEIEEFDAGVDHPLSRLEAGQIADLSSALAGGVDLEQRGGKGKLRHFGHPDGFVNDATDSGGVIHVQLELLQRRPHPTEHRALLGVGRHLQQTQLGHSLRLIHLIILIRLLPFLIQVLKIMPIYHFSPQTTPYCPYFSLLVSLLPFLKVWRVCSSKTSLIFAFQVFRHLTSFKFDS